MSELIDKLVATFREHFAENGDSDEDFDFQLLSALVALAGAVISSDPTNIRGRRAIFDEMLTKGLYELTSRRRH
jgi:hypothetical protein